MNTNGIFARRLKNARVMKGYSMDDLVSRMGNSVSKMTISKLEREMIAPSSSLVLALSRALEMPVDYFFRPFTVEIDSIRFRASRSRMSLREENALKSRISDMTERYLSIEEICNASVFFVSPVTDVIATKEDVRKAAADVRTAWRLGLDGIVSIIDLFEEKGIKVMEIDAPSSFAGVSAVVNNTSHVVVLNSSHSPESKRFTACHELGHFALNFDSSVSDKEEEKLCHLFASELLLPQSVFTNILGFSRMSLSYQEMKALQLRYGISCDALVYKAKECGIITQSRYRSFCVKKNSDPRFKAMVEESYWPKEESLRFSSLVFRALSDELITASKAAVFLGRDAAEVRAESYQI